MKTQIDEIYLISERKRIGQMIKEKREAKGLTHHQLAEIIGVSYATISKVENGKWNFGIDTVSKFGAALDFKADLASLK